ncbi:T9SS type A sorting domain-containing protein [Hymenobacter algoricola]|uniref:Secretion system C-terminal sorting domain-containing protein n=1 Tax=Hymenobacter algoricola TaxID=486267 RepID=A0ABP7MNT0_9BACT
MQNNSANERWVIDEVLVRGTAVATPTPTITLSPAALNAFTTTQGTASASQSYTVAGSNLTADISVVPPAGYQLALETTPGSNTPGTFTAYTAATPLVLTQTGGTVATTRIFARLAATTTVAGSPYDGNITHTSGTATAAKAVTGTVTAANTPSATGFTPAAGPVGTILTISGTNLGTITGVTVNGTAATSVSATATAVTATVAAGTGTGAVVLSDGTTTYTVPGGSFTVTAEPVVTTTAASAITATTATTGGSFVTNGATITERGVVYGTAANPRIGVGDALKASVTGTTSPFTANLTGLTASTTYFVAAYTISEFGTTYDATDETFTTATPTPITITTGTVATTPIFAGGSVTVSFTTTGTFNGGNTFTAELSDAAGNFPGTTLTTVSSTSTTLTVTIPAATTPGAAYVIRVNGSSPATTGSTSAAFTVTDAPLLAFDFEGTDNVTTAPSSSNNPNVNPSTFSRSGVLSNPGANRFNSRNWSATIDAAKYMTFTFTPNANYQATLTSLTFVDQRSGSISNPYEVRSSLDNFATALASGTTAGGGKSVPLSGFTNLTAAVEFRFYYAVSSTGSTYSVDNVNLFGTVQVVSNAISAPAFTGTTFCAGSSFNVKFTPTGTFAAANSFVVQLSNAAGSFAAPVVVATLLNNSSNLAQTASVTIPATTATGSGYRLRVVSTDPAVTSPSSAAFGVLNAPTVTVAPAADQTISANVNGATLTATETPAAASRQWVYSTTPGGSNTVITGQTATTYAPNFPTAGDYYVKVISTFAACDPVTSNEVKITVTVPVASLTATPTSLTFSATVGTPAPVQSYLLTGANLPPAALVSIAAQNPAFEVSVTSASTGFAATQQATAATDGSLSQTVYVRFTAPGMVGTTISSIENTSGALSAPVAVTGMATAVPVAGAPGNLVLEEYFNYPAGDDLKTHGWAAQGTGTTPITVVVGNAAFATYPLGVADTTTSRRVKLVPSGDDLNKSFVLAGATTFYAAVTAKVSVATTNGDYFLHFYDAVTTTPVTFRGRVFARAATGGYQLGLQMTGSVPASPVYSSQVFDLNTSYVVVLKYEVRPSGDVASLYALGSGSSTLAEPVTPLVTVTGADSYAALNAVALRQGGPTSAATLTVDGVRVATGWGAAVGRAVLTAPAATLNAGNYYSLTLNNADVLTPTGIVNVEGPLTLTSGLVATSAANGLTLYPTATVVGASNASYVNGVVKRVVTAAATPTADLVFPVGKDGIYRPASLSVAAQTSTTTYAGELFNASARSTAVTAPLTRVSDIRYVSITPEGGQPTGFRGTVTLSFGADDRVTDPALASFVIAKRSTSTDPWLSIDRSTSTGTASSGAFVAGTLTSGEFTSFSDFALASTDPSAADNPLPVELTRFTATRQAENVQLSWATASEKNNARFEVQRSADGQHFTLVATVEGQGQSTQAHAYTAFDRQPLRTLAYYRLRQVDFDGKSSFSPVVAVAGSLEVSLYPNPARAELHLRVPAAATYRVLNALGSVVLTGSVAEGAATLPVAQLPAGLYHVEVTSGAGRVVRKFIKEN